MELKSKTLRNHPRFKVLVVSFVLFAFAVGYMVYGLTSKCGGFEGKPCPRGFKCNLSETPGYVVYGDLDQCIVNTEGFTK